MLHYLAKRQIRIQFHPGGMQPRQPPLFTSKSNIFEILTTKTLQHREHVSVQSRQNFP